MDDSTTTGVAPRRSGTVIVRLLHPAGSSGVTFWFAVAAVGMTWPLARGLGRDVPWDFGDPLFNCWVIGWNAEHALRILSGDWSAVGNFWNGNIFYPEPLTLAYSELLYAQSLFALPVYAATRNLILSYNLLFLSTYVLSALGAYLFVRQLTGDWRAALVAGLAFGFAPNRAAQGSHLQVLSSQWMPLALYGFRRYFDTGSRKALAGGTVAVVLQNWSCGYHLLFFSLLLPCYVVWELASRHRLSDLRAWRPIAMSAGAVALATVPVMWPYVALRTQQPGLKRSNIDIESYSADVYSYLTAPPSLRVWRRLQTYPRPEGELFPGSGVIVLSLVAIVLGMGSMAGGGRDAGLKPCATAAKPDATGAKPGATGEKPAGLKPCATGGKPCATEGKPGAAGETPGATGGKPVATGETTRETGAAGWMKRMVAWVGLGLAAASIGALAFVLATGWRPSIDRSEAMGREVVMQQQIDRATRRVAERGYQAGPHRADMEGFPWEKFDPMHPQARTIKMVAARVFEHIDPYAPDAVDRAAEALRADGVDVARVGVDRLRFPDESEVDVLVNSAAAAGVPGAAVSWTWLVIDPPAPVVAPQLLAVTLSGLVVAIGLWRPWRLRTWQALGSPTTFFVLVAMVAWWLSLGPIARSMGVEVGGFGLYGWVVGYLPGFDGIRATGRMAVLVFLALSVVAGLGLARLLKLVPRAAGVLTALGVVWVLADGVAVPLPLNGNWTDAGLAYPPARVFPFRQAPEPYRFVRTLPIDAVLIELPFGVTPWEIRHTYAATYHWRPILNGFSGFLPVSYRARHPLREPMRDRERAWEVLTGSEATHVILHRDAYPPPPAPRAGEAEAIAAWLEGHGAARVADFGHAVVYRLPGPSPQG